MFSFSSFYRVPRHPWNSILTSLSFGNMIMVALLPSIGGTKVPGMLHSISIRFFQCFSYIIDRVHQNSPYMHFRWANTDSGGPIRIQEGQYGVRRANTELSMHFRKANTEPSMYFRRANTETY